MRDLMQKPENADFVWRRLQYVFGLPDPNAFPVAEVEWEAREREMLQRFVAHARSIAGTSLLAADDNVHVSLDDFTDEETVESDLAPQDLTTGFLTMLRQCYANGEEASFAKVQGILGRRLKEAGLTDALDIVTQWRKAHAALMNKSLEELVQEQLIRDKKMPGPATGPDSAVVRDPASPHELLLAFQYGSLIHWGKQTNALVALQRDPFDTAMSDMAMRAVALDFAHFYLGFATLIERVLSS